MNLTSLLHPLRSFFEKLEMKEEIIFLSKEEAQSYLSRLTLSPSERKIVDASFRTRVRKIANTLEFQFRVSPSALTGDDEIDTLAIQSALQSKLAAIIPEQHIVVTLKISDCCGKGCYGCEKYGK